MVDDDAHAASVERLLEQILESGDSPEEACRACPELLLDVRAGLRQLRELEDQVGALFPPSNDGDTGPLETRVPTELPVVPGYEVLGVLGQGGMGIVFRARHLRLNRQVALKMILAGAFASPTQRQRFLREAEAVAAIDHPNIVRVLDAGESEGRPWFTMELVEGGSLARRNNGAPQAARHSTALLASISEAIALAHRHGIIHRDLKPANILLTTEATPKVADFGLARWADDAGETLSGSAIGTPSYMAPEQARGASREISPATDVYALGAILYELLTGRPPFRGETGAATIQQMLTNEVVPPSRLNPRVPRDLQTICVKCLQKEPSRRYADAAALAENLRRFGRGEPVMARPVGQMERLARWAQRHPAESIGLVASLLVASILIGVAWYGIRQRSATRRAVNRALEEVVRLQRASDWDAARAVLEGANDRLAAGGPADLRRRLDHASRSLRLVAALDAVRLERATLVEGRSDNATADRAYEAVFRQAGLGDVYDDPKTVAGRITASDVREPLVAALDDWAVCADDKRRQTWLLEVARRSDPDPWRDRVRDPRVWGDPAALAELARTAALARQPVHLLLALGERLQATGGEATGFLRRVQLDYPADFFADFGLGAALDKREPGDAIGYYRAALAIRPAAVAVHYNLGNALAAAGRLDEAIDHYQWALRIDPQHAWAHTALGNVLEAKGLTREALQHYQQAIDRYQQVLHTDPRNTWAHLSLGIGLRAQSQLDESIDHYRCAVALNPQNSTAQTGLRTVLLERGRGEEARDVWRTAIEASPADHDTWYGYTELCLFLGHEDEYRRVRTEMLRRFRASTDPFVAERTARASLLLPASQDELQQAVGLIERALSAERSKYDWAYPFFMFARGLADYRQGLFNEAISVLTGEASKVHPPASRIIVAMALYRQGRTQEARKTLAEGIVAYDWSPARATENGVWIRHVLRREAEAMILPNLPAFIDGKYRPRDSDERLALLGACQFKDLRVAMAGLYADAFAADSKLADDLAAAHRYHAACAAAVAGSGGGADGASLNEQQRARWREQARQWLREDLAARASELQATKPADRAQARKTLAGWREDPDLASLRDPLALKKLPPAEAEECRAIWRSLDQQLDETPQLPQ